MNKKILSLFVLLVVVLGATKAFASLTFSSAAITGDSASTIDVGAGNALSLQTVGNGNILTGSGNVGIGITPTSKLHVAGDIRGDGILLGNDIDVTRTIFPEANQTATIITAPLNVGDSYYTNFSTGVTANFSTPPTLPFALNGISAFVMTSSSNVGNLTQFNGMSGGVQHWGSGNLTDAKGVIGSSHNSGAGIVTNLKGSEFVYANLGSGSTTNAYGIFVESPSNDGNGAGSNNITNAYGLYIQDQNKGTNKWNIYSDGATSRNYFAGKVGIGTATPGSKLSIVGLSVYADNTAALAGGLIAGDVYRTATGVLMITY